MLKTPVIKISLLMLLFAVNITICHAQQTTNYDLAKLLTEHNLDTTLSNQAQVISDYNKHAISVKGIIWLKDADFKEGTIDVDLRGKNVFLKSFMGIAFHARDTTAYDVVYFCPFRFHDTSYVTRKYSVKYMSVPDYGFEKLRKDHPGVYENEVNPAPPSDGWFHATIEIKDDWITVYINHSTTPSLKVKRLNTLTSGKIGLWSYAPTLDSDFANLTIKSK